MGRWAKDANFFEQQLRGLQGSWTEDGKQSKEWIVSGGEAVQQSKDGRPMRSRRFTIAEGAHGGAVWGTGLFVLDVGFKKGSKVAQWHSSTADGKIAFSWNYAGPLTSAALSLEELRSDAQEARERRDAAAANGGRQLVEGAKVVERRVDPTDGVAYTWEELRGMYAGTYTKRECAAYWEACAAGQRRSSKAEASVAEKRIDPLDGCAYTLAELRKFYSATYTKKATEDYWNNCKPVGGGRSNWEEAPKAKAKVKAKAKAKEKAMPKAKAKVKSKAKAKLVYKPKDP